MLPTAQEQSTVTLIVTGQLEENYDFVYVYDGTSFDDPLVFSNHSFTLQFLSC